jgi:hypothetical protein
LIDFNEKFFLSNLLNNEYIHKYFFSLDLSIFCKPIGLHYIFFVESKIFIKFLKMGVLHFFLKKFRLKFYNKWRELEQDFLELES